jgi:hypothetical protein
VPGPRTVAAPPGMPQTCRGRKAEERAGPLSRYDDTWILRVLCSLLATVRPHVLAQTVRTGCSRVGDVLPTPRPVSYGCRIHAVLGIWNMTSPARYLCCTICTIYTAFQGLAWPSIDLRTDAGGWKQDVTIRISRRSAPPRPKEPSKARIPSTNSPEDAPSSEPDHRRTARGEGGRECERTGSIRPQWRALEPLPARRQSPALRPCAGRRTRAVQPVLAEHARHLRRPDSLQEVDERRCTAIYG